MKGKMGSLLSMVIMGIIGILLLFFPGAVSDLLIRLVGAGLFIFGLSGILSVVMQKDFRASRTANLVGSIAVLAVGLVLFFNPGLVTGIFHIVLGVLILWFGISNLLSALDSGNKVAILLPLVSVVLGVLILIGIFSATDLVLRIAGAVMLYDAVVGLWAALKA
ncbi:MAG: DUF308 domain-containing protein [Lachnospiraceae bacterium]|nr:DUF308 domain-containing protein [Lachnospiraceae bacterium]